MNFQELIQLHDMLIFFPPRKNNTYQSCVFAIFLVRVSFAKNRHHEHDYSHKEKIFHFGSLLMRKAMVVVSLHNNRSLTYLVVIRRINELISKLEINGED